jgi:hypothetical protein
MGIMLDCEGCRQAAWVAIQTVAVRIWLGNKKPSAVTEGFLLEALSRFELEYTDLQSAA